MTDPTFGDMAFCGDAWDGLVPVDFASACTSAFVVHVWAGEFGPSHAQRERFEQLKVRYPDLWPTLISTLRDLHPDLSTDEDVRAGLSPTVGCYIEPDGGSVHADFELVYEFDREGENGRGFFLRMSGWQIAEAVIAE